MNRQLKKKIFKITKVVKIIAILLLKKKRLARKPICKIMSTEIHSNTLTTFTQSRGNLLILLPLMYQSKSLTHKIQIEITKILQ